MQRQVFPITLLAILVMMFACKNTSDPENQNEDDTPPQVTILQPLADDTITSDTTIMVSASDNDQVLKVSVYIDNTLIGEDTTIPYEIIWNIDSLQDEQHYSISATASDLSGNIGYSDTITVSLYKGLVLPDSGLTFIDHIQPLFIGKCALSGCHSTIDRVANLDLTNYSEIMNHMFSGGSTLLVIIHNGDQSPLYLILVTNNFMGVPQMPLPGNYLNANNSAGVKTWIDEGAVYD